MIFSARNAPENHRISFVTNSQQNKVIFTIPTAYPNYSSKTRRNLQKSWPQKEKSTYRYFCDGKFSTTLFQSPCLWEIMWQMQTCSAVLPIVLWTVDFHFYHHPRIWFHPLPNGRPCQRLIPTISWHISILQFFFGCCLHGLLRRNRSQLKFGLSSISFCKESITFG